MKSFLTYLEEDEQWITIGKKQNPEHKGRHVLINMETGDIIKGLGNKFKNLKDLGGNTTDIDSEFATKKKKLREYDPDKITETLSKDDFDHYRTYNINVKSLLTDFPDLEEEEAISLVAYTLTYYRKLNNDSDKFEDTRNMLSNALLKLPIHEGVVKRTSQLPADVLKSYLENDYVTTGNRFTSTTKNLNFDFTSMGHSFIIKSKTSRDIHNYSEHSNEEEVLFDRDTNFKIVDRNQKSDGSYVFTMEEI